MKKINLNSNTTPVANPIRRAKAHPEQDPTLPHPAAIGYHSVCFYSISGSDYPEENHQLAFSAPTLQGLIDKITAYHKKLYLLDTDYIDTTNIDWGTIHSSHGGPLSGKFSTAYIFGPKVTYHIYIHPIWKSDLNIDWNF